MGLYDDRDDEINSIDRYQVATGETAVYPDAHTRYTSALVYTALGLAGEAGEIANKVKKLMRDGDTDARRDVIRGELGDVFWYLARLADELDINLSEVALENLRKLNSRAERGTLQGSGDNR